MAWSVDPASGGAFSCAGDEFSSGAPLCSYSSASTAVAAAGAGDASSCGFLLPAGNTLTCSVSNGKVTFIAATATSFTAPYVAPTQRNSSGSTLCPPATSPPQPNDCDCSFDNQLATGDAIVTVTARSVDSSFNSFYCVLDGVTVGAWGSNSGMANSSGTLTFIVPQNNGYECIMQWGAAAFSYSSRLIASRSLFTLGGDNRDVTNGQLRHKSLGEAQVTRAQRRASLPDGPAFIHPESEMPRLQRLWSTWKEQHHRVYSSGQSEVAAFTHFAQHVAAADQAVVRGKILHHPHLDESGRPHRFNAFADMSRRQWEATYRHKAVIAEQAEKTMTLLDQAAAPSSMLPPPPPPPPAVDWRTKGVVTPVKDQGQCGGCWAFSTTGALEGAWALAGRGLTSLSEQQLVSCANNSGNNGCGGGWPALGTAWLIDNPPDTEASYPYVSGGGSAPACQASGHASSGVNVTGWQTVRPDVSSGNDDMETALAAWTAAYGPVSVLVDAMTQIWWVYNGGIISDCCDTDIDHAVLLVGYNQTASSDDAGEQYWIIKNSWAASWGEQGYARLMRGAGECGINATGNSIVPTVQGGPLPPASIYDCPPDAQPMQVNATTSGCVWTNGTGSFVMPPSPQGYCYYLDDGYMGYTFDASLDQAAYPCPPSFYASEDEGQVWFCVLQAPYRGFHGFPPGAAAYCDDLAAGRIGYTWSTS